MKNLELLESLLIERQLKLNLLNFNPLEIPIFHVDHKIWSMRPVKLDQYFEILYKISSTQELSDFAYPQFGRLQLRFGIYEEFVKMLSTLHEFILLRRQVDNCHRKIGVLKKSDKKFYE